jgi:hypothetical protein
MPARPTLVALLAFAAVVVAGCRDPYTNDQRPSSLPAAPVTRTATVGDGDSPGPPIVPTSDRESDRRASAREVAAAFARGWSNWDWQRAAVQPRALARLATGGLVAQLRSSARSASADASLARDRPGARGSVIAVDLKQTDGAARAGVVVTREQSYTGGHADLGGEHYRVYLVRLVHVAGGWVVSEWAPQQ